MNDDAHMQGQPSIIDDEERAAQVSEILKSIAHPLRVRIIALLLSGPKNVSELSERLGAKQPVISQQLRILRMRGLVGVKRDASFSYYQIAEPNLHTLMGCMEGCTLRH